MSATCAGGSSSSAIDFGAEAIEGGIAMALRLPRAVAEANLRASSALVDLAGQRLHAETEFLERLLVCRDIEQASAVHVRFIASMIGEGGHELTELMAVACENAAHIADAAGAAPAVHSV